MKKNKKSKILSENRTLRTFTLIVFWLIVWEGLSLLVHQSLLLPSPKETLKALASLATQKSFYLDIIYTLIRCIFGVLLSFILGLLLSWTSYRHDFVRSFLKGPVSFLKSIPVMAIIIYLILILSSDKVAVVVCFFMCFPISYTNLLRGLDSTLMEYIEVSKIYNFKMADTLRYIYLPSIMPDMKSALHLMCGMSWKVVIASEILSVPTHSLGYEMLNAKYYLQTDYLFSYIIVIIVLSNLFEKLVDNILGKFKFEAYEKSRLLHKSLSYGRRCITKEERKAITLKLNDISKGFYLVSTAAKSEKSVICDLNLELEGGKVTALMGSSGRGKTTLARIISGLEVPDSGSISLYTEKSEEGDKLPLKNQAACCETQRGTKKVYTYSAEEPSSMIGELSKRLNASYLFQEDRLLPWLNVYDNLALSQLTSGIDDKKVREMAALLELSDVLYKLPVELSGGMRHRVALGRTFLKETDFMILDEPFRGLDSELRLRIQEKSWETVTIGKTVLLITHSEEDAERLADKTVYMI